MDTAQFHRNAVAAAAIQLARAEAELKSAQKTASQTAAGRDWLEDCPDLRRQANLIEDLPQREEEFGRRLKMYEEALAARLETMRGEDPFHPSDELDASISFYRQFVEGLRAPGPELRLNRFLNDPHLRPNDRAILDRRVNNRCYPPEIGDGGVGWIRFRADVSKYVGQLEAERQDKPKQYDLTLRAAAKDELEGLWYNVEAARSALSDAKNALGNRPAIDQLVKSRIDHFMALETRRHLDKFDAARKAAEHARNRCVEAFQLALAADFLAARPGDFAPTNARELREQLDDETAEFVRAWADRNGMKTLDTEQATAIGSVHDHVLATARAGSGKTLALTTRVAFLVHYCQVPPERILLLAFNKKVRKEMREALVKIGCDIPHVMTFHALAHALVHPERPPLRDDDDGNNPALSRMVQESINDLSADQAFDQDRRRLMLNHFRVDWDLLERAEHEVERNVARPGLEFGDPRLAGIQQLGQLRLGQVPFRPPLSPTPWRMAAPIAAAASVSAAAAIITRRNAETTASSMA
jgi:AAA domain